MSDLADVLAGLASPGAYRWDAHVDVADVAEVEQSGRRLAHLDGVGTGSVTDFHTAVAEALAFPSYYGRNLDALEDCLRAVPATTVLLWDAWAPFARSEPRVFAVALELLGAALTVLLHGDGPDVAVPLLD